MKLQDYRDTFYEYSGKASEINRHLAFAGIAFIWLFKMEIKSIDDWPSLAELSSLDQTLLVPKALLPAGLLMALSLVFDMTHYLVASFIWRSFYRQKEKEKVSEEVNLQHPICLENVIWVLFVIKILLLIVGYFFILKFLFKALGL